MGSSSVVEKVLSLYFFDDSCLLYSNLVTSLIYHERIMTTTPKAKELRRVTEKMITHAKKGN